MGRAVLVCCCAGCLLPLSAKKTDLTLRRRLACLKNELFVSEELRRSRAALTLQARCALCKHCFSLLIHLMRESYDLHQACEKGTEDDQILVNDGLVRTERSLVFLKLSKQARCAMRFGGLIIAWPGLID